VTRAADERAVAAILYPVKPTLFARLLLPVAFAFEILLKANKLLPPPPPSCWLLLFVIGFDDMTDDWNVELAFGCLSCPYAYITNGSIRLFSFVCY